MDWPFPRLPQWSLSAYKVTWDEIVWIFHEKVRKREIMLPISTDTYITHSGLCTSVADNSLSVHSYLAQCKLHRCSKKKCWIGPELRTLKTKYHCARSLCFDKFGWKVGWNCWKSEMTRTKYMFLNDLLSMDYRLKDGSLLEWSRSVWNCVKCKAAIFKLLSHWRCLLMSLWVVFTTYPTPTPSLGVPPPPQIVMKAPCSLLADSGTTQRPFRRVTRRLRWNLA